MTSFFNERGVTRQSLLAFNKRQAFSDYLPWLLYDDRSKYFLNIDNSQGIIWECVPLVIMGADQISKLENLVAINYPKGTVIQFILQGDENINNFVDSYRDTCVRDVDILHRMTDEYIKFLLEGRSGIENNHFTPTRNFRLLVTVKFKDEPDIRIIREFEELLVAVGLRPTRWGVTDLLCWARQFLNHNEDNYTDYDKSKRLNGQIIDPDQIYQFKNDMPQFGDYYGCCLTPKLLSGESCQLDVLKTNQIIGGLIDECNLQLTGPFLYTVNLFFGIDVKSYNLKCSYMMNTKALGTFSLSLKKRIEEFMKAFDLLDNQNSLVKVMPIVWTWDKSRQQLEQNVSRLSNLWRSRAGMRMRQESILSKPLFIASQPFGLYDIKDNIDTLARDFLVPSQTAACLLPVQGDIRGSAKPVVPFIGRKGQVGGLDLFDPRSSAYNFLVVAKTGSGKTFFLNWLCQNHYKNGAKIRLIDMGGGYKKLCDLLGGRFIDIGVDSQDLCLNPFDFVDTGDQEDIDSCIDAAKYVIGEMAYSASGGSPDETEWSLITRSVLWTLGCDRKLDGLDAVYEYLESYPLKDEGVLGGMLPEEIINKAHNLAFNLLDYTSKGRYGRYFIGKSTLDIASDDLVVLELDRLRQHGELCSVILMQVVNIITQDLYLSDRSTPRFILFEEMASLLSQGGGKDFSRLGTMIDQGYMRARKYFGSFGIVIQSLSHLFSNYPALAESILANSIYKFMFQSDYTRALDDHILHYEGLARELLESLEKKSSSYSEIFVDSEICLGVVRIVVDSFTYWMNTSSGDDVTVFNELLAKGMTTLEAIEELSFVSH